MPDLTRRAFEHEYMDDWTTADGLVDAARELEYVNRLLGGYSSMRSALTPYLIARRSRRVVVMDVASGIGDIPAAIVRWGMQAGVDIHVIAVEANPDIVTASRSWLDRRMDAAVRSRIELRADTVESVLSANEPVDVVTASLFLHHIPIGREAAFLRQISTLARDGVVVSDLHRNRIAYHGIRIIASALGASPIFRHDGPLSVRRGFKRDELVRFALDAGLGHAKIHWKWAFRWVLTTLG